MNPLFRQCSPAASDLLLGAPDGHQVHGLAHRHVRHQARQPPHVGHQPPHLPRDHPLLLRPLRPHRVQELSRRGRGQEAIRLISISTWARKICMML